MKANLSEPLVSVVIPAYNCEKWIHKTLTSVFNQTYKNIEIIIVNDGSTDNTGEILEEYNQLENVLIYTIENSGPAVARNYGVSKSHGELIAFLDADDMWDPTKVEKQVSYINKNNANLIITNVKVINERDIIIDTQEKKLPKTRENQVISFFKGEITMNTPTIMVKRSVFKDIGGFNVDLVHKEDHFFLMQVAYKYGIHLIDEFLVYRRKWNDSMSNDIDKIKPDVNNIIDYYYKTRYYFYELSIKTFPFLEKYLSKELGRFNHNLAIRLFRAGFVKDARTYLKNAIKHHFSLKYVIKLLYLYLPNSLRIFY